MKNIKMQTICLRCRNYHAISYVDGSGGIGCCHDSMLPVDIRNMECCPMGKDDHVMVMFDKVELLKILGDIYVQTCNKPAELSLTKMFKELGRSYRGKKQLLSMAVVQLGIVKIVDKNGLIHSYKWNTSSPSLEMVDKVCDRIVELQRKRYNDASRKKKKVCDNCRFSELTGCRKVFRELGIDCMNEDMSKIKVVIDG